MFTVYTLTHPGPDWDGGCHAGQTFDHYSEALDHLVLADWDRYEIEDGLNAAKRTAAPVMVDPHNGEAYTVHLEIIYRASVNPDAQADALTDCDYCGKPTARDADEKFGGDVVCADCAEDAASEVEMTDAEYHRDHPREGCE